MKHKANNPKSMNKKTSSPLFPKSLASQEKRPLKLLTPLCSPSPKASKMARKSDFQASELSEFFFVLRVKVEILERESPSKFLLKRFQSSDQAHR